MCHIASTRGVHAGEENFDDVCITTTDCCVANSSGDLGALDVDRVYMRPSEKTLVRFAECTVKPYIPRICRNFLDFLAIEHEPHKLRV